MTSPLNEVERKSLQPQLLNLRVIVFALCMGVSTYAGISIYQKIPAPVAGPQPLKDLLQKQPKEIKTLQIAAPFLAGAAAALAFLVPPFLRNLNLNAKPPGNRDEVIKQAAEILQQRTIVACALLEAAAFFNVFCYFTTDSIYNLAMAGILLLLLLLHPAERRVLPQD